MINRVALLLYYKAPFIKWINESDPSTDASPVTAEEANRDKTVYLIDEEEVEHLDEWIEVNLASLFESELDCWYADESLWPPNRDLELFHQWFDVQCHTVLIDAGSRPIVDDQEEGVN